MLHRNRIITIMLCFMMVMMGECVRAQNEVPFTIRYPPDGSIVREKVPVKVPLASIPVGGYISVDIDGHFVVAMAPTAEDRANGGAGADYVYTWDTKSPMQLGRGQVTYPEDGEHTITVSLYTPRPSDQGNGDMLSATSSIKVQLKNKVDMSAAVTLRYRFTDGDVFTYTRSGTTDIKGGPNQQQDTLNAYMQKSQLDVSIDDKYSNGDAMVRNKLTKLSITHGAQETIFPTEQLPKSLYEELDALGNVHYQNNTSASFAEFARLGIPVSATIDLPILPENPVNIGDSWETPNVPIDIPGVTPNQQPKEKVKSTLVSFEWQDGYPAAKIHQHYDGYPEEKAIDYQGMQIDHPHVIFDRDIWVAFRAGLLCKVYRTIDVSGKLLENNLFAGGSPYGPGMGGSPYSGMGGSPYSGMGSSPYSGMGSSPYSGMKSSPYGSMGYGGSPYSGAGSNPMNPYMGAKGPYGGSSAYPGPYGGSGGYPGYPGSPGYNPYMGGVQTKPQATEISLKSTMTTEIIPKKTSVPATNSQ